MDENKTFNISMPKSFLDAIDKQAEIEFRNRSDLIREAVRSYITNKGGFSTATKLTGEEESRLRENLKFGNFKNEPVIILSCTFRPQPNSISKIFESNSDVIELLENPPQHRKMGWDLQTLDRARPVAGEYLELTNGTRKLLRLYRDGQFVFSGGLNFFGHGVNKNLSSPSFNLLSVADFMLNFANFSQMLAKCLDIKAETIIYTVAVSNPTAHDEKFVNLQAYDGLSTDKVGELTIDWAQRNITLNPGDSLSNERIAYLIYSEFSYFFGLRGDELWYVDKDKQEINKERFSI